MAGKETGTVFTPGMTSQGFNENGESIPVLMSPAGKKMASHTAPSDAYSIRTTSTAAVKGGK